jgi:hypothetical protein
MMMVRGIAHQMAKALDYWQTNCPFEDQSMVDRPCVVLVGTSLLMDGIAISLAGIQMLGLERADLECSDLQERLKRVEPDLIVFELDHPLVSSIRSMLKAKSELLLIAFDIESCHAFVLNSRQQMTKSMADLCRLVEEEVYQALHSRKEVRAVN